TISAANCSRVVPVRMTAPGFSKTTLPALTASRVSARNFASSRLPMATSAPPSANRSPFSLLRTMTRISAPLWSSVVTTAEPTCPVAPAIVNIESPLWPGPAPRPAPVSFVSARNRLLRAAGALVGGGVARARVHPDGNDDEGVGRAFSGDEGRPAGVAVRAEGAIRAEGGVGQVRTVEHHVGGVGAGDAPGVGHQVLRRQHVIDARPGRRLEHALGERVSHEALDLFGALSLSAQLGHLQYTREERARALRIHALWFLAGGQ